MVFVKFRLTDDTIVYVNPSQVVSFSDEPFGTDTRCTVNMIGGSTYQLLATNSEMRDALNSGLNKVQVVLTGNPEVGD